MEMGRSKEIPQRNKRYCGGCHTQTDPLQRGIKFVPVKLTGFNKTEEIFLPGTDGGIYRGVIDKSNANNREDNFQYWPVNHPKSFDLTPQGQSDREKLHPTVIRIPENPILLERKGIGARVIQTVCSVPKDKIFDVSEILFYTDKQRVSSQNKRSVQLSDGNRGGEETKLKVETPVTEEIKDTDGKEQEDSEIKSSEERQVNDEEAKDSEETKNIEEPCDSDAFNESSLNQSEVEDSSAADNVDETSSDDVQPSIDDVIEPVQETAETTPSLDADGNPDVSEVTQDDEPQDQAANEVPEAAEANIAPIDSETPASPDNDGEENV